MRSGVVKGEQFRVLCRCARSRMANEAISTILACVGQACLRMKRQRCIWSCLLKIYVRSKGIHSDLAPSVAWLPLGPTGALT